MNCDDIVTMFGYYPSDMTAITQLGGLKVDNLRYSTFKEKKSPSVSGMSWLLPESKVMPGTSVITKTFH